MTADDVPGGEQITDEQRRAMRNVILGAVAITLWSFTAGGNVRNLFALRLGATDAQVGLLSALPHLILALQIFCVRWVQRHGKKRILFPSLALAAMILTAQALTPMVGRTWGQPAAITYLMTIVGLAALVWVPGNTAWFPLLNDCVPSSIRGRFFARMRTCWLLVALVAMLGLMAWLGREKDAPLIRYQIIFAISFVWALLVIASFWRLPETSSEQETSLLPLRRVWSLVLSDRRFLLFVAAHSLTSGLWMLMLVFTAAYVKRGLLYPEWLIIFSHPFGWALGSVATLWLWGRMVDSVGNRSVFIISIFMYLAVAAGWMLVLSASTNAKIWMGVLSAAGGAAWSGYFIAATRQVLVMAPRENQTPYLSAWMAGRGIGFAAGPVLAGVVLEAMGRRSLLPVRPGVWHVNRYTLCFGATALGFAICAFLFSRLRTPGEMGTRQVAGRLIARLTSWR